MKKISLYIHIPFCDSKCYYCDFTSFVGMNHKLDDYIKALILELDLYKNKMRDYSIETIFIGGGTPSAISASYIYLIMEYIYINYNCHDLKEITIESNPGSLSKDKIKIYKEVGINRISLGAQSFDDILLNLIGRTHSSKDIYDSVYILRENGFSNINLDLMFGLPNQNLESHMRSISKAIELDVEHISNYSLILEKGTHLYNMYNDGKINIVSDKLDREIYHKSLEYLVNNNYLHYEISNYCKKGFQSLHNLSYWNVDKYLGLGIASHSNMNGKRFYNTSNLDKYISLINKGILAIEGVKKIDKIEEISEYCIMGFRKIKGINKEKFKDRFKQDIEDIYLKEINKNERNGLIRNGTENISLTNKGLDLLNLVELDFYKY